MKDRIFVITALIVALMLVSTTVAPSRAFVYPEDPEDNYFELFGPRIDELLIKKYNGLDAEMTALQNGEIDITDSSLTKKWVDNFTSDPNIGMSKYGGEAGYYTINFNHNNNTYLGNPEDPAYPNLVYPNPASIPEFRQACSHLVDRDTLCSGPGQGMYEPIFTPIPAYMTYWIHPNISYTGSLSVLTYPPSVAVAAAKLDAGGFHLGGAGGKRYWDKNDNNVYDGASEDFNIIFYTRQDALRKGAADMLCAGFDDPAIQVPYARYTTPIWQHVMVEKIYHLYTAGWIYIGPDPDYLYDLYHWDNYYHPEDPPNFGAISEDDPLMQEYLEETKFASTQQDVLNACLSFQERFAEVAAEVPLASSSAPKAYNKWYTGGNNGQTVGDAEDKYRNQSWTQIVNERGEGENSVYTTLNAYAGTCQYGDGNMIMRYGWSDNAMPFTLNPMYYSWYWEEQVINRIYDKLFDRDPTTKGPASSYSIVQNWTLGTWTDPRDGKNYSKITMSIRPGVFWSDGVPFTIDDVIYTVGELPNELEAKGVPPPWWCGYQNYVEGFRKLDEYSAEFLMNVETYLAPNYFIRGNWWYLQGQLLPQHIWQPYIAAHTVAEITGDLSDNPELLVGTGPFVFIENTADTLTLVKNPYYYQRISTASMRFDETGYKQGVTAVALAPSAQITPFKIQVDTRGLGSARITVPAINLDVDDECYVHERIELVCPNTTVVVLKDEAILHIQPFEMLSDTFDMFNLERGEQIIKVTLEIVDGPLYDWVTATLPSGLWPSILGPKTIEQSFWVTVPADINSDNIVDIFDITIVATAFGSTLGSKDFDGTADLNRDYVVDIFDIVKVALWFGWN